MQKSYLKDDRAKDRRGKLKWTYDVDKTRILNCLINLTSCLAIVLMT